MNAQQVSSLSGEYYLTSVMETASGFKLNPDSSFQFFFSFGALDRYGEGKWSVKDGRIFFNSRPRPELDFGLNNSSQTSEDSIRIKITDANELLLRYVHCTIKSGDIIIRDVTDRTGIATFPKLPIDSISLVFEFCPEKTSVFIPKNPQDNYFEFRFEPWIVEYFFKEFSLNVGEKTLDGIHPLLTGEGYTYRKND
jgi:hypothetical protein